MEFNNGFKIVYTQNVLNSHRATQQLKIVYHWPRCKRIGSPYGCSPISLGRLTLITIDTLFTFSKMEETTSGFSSFFIGRLLL